MTSILPDLERELERRAEAAVDASAGAPRTDRGRGPRRRLRLAMGSTAVAAMAILVLLALPFGDRTSLDVVAEARAALDSSRSIIHTVTVRRIGPFPSDQETVYGNGERVAGRYLAFRVERWTTAEPLRYHEISRQIGASEATRHEQAFADLRFTEVDREVLRTTTVSPSTAASLHALRTASGALSATGPFPEDPVQGLRSLLDTGTIRPAGERTVDGRRVLRLVPSDPAADRRAAEAVRSQVGMLYPTEYLVDAETYAPVRVTYTFPSSTVAADPQPVLTSTITFETFERLDPTPENERLLAIDPAGRRVVEDPDMFRGKKMSQRPRREAARP